MTAPGPLYAWMVFDTDERWGIIGAIIPGLPGTGLTPLVMRDESLARSLRSLAEAHGRACGREVGLFRFDRATEVGLQ